MEAPNKKVVVSNAMKMKKVEDLNSVEIDLFMNDQSPSLLGTQNAVIHGNKLFVQRVEKHFQRRAHRPRIENLEY
jgi:putative NADH-flavin reductase